MEYTISNRLKDVQGSIIRELFKLAKDPSIISFGGGNPAAETFPVAEISRFAAQALADNPAEVLQYGLSPGYLPLRETMKVHLAKTQQIDFSKNELFIISGGQQAADLVTKVLVNEGDTIICEDPSFVGCLNSFRSYGAKLVGVPMQSDGMDIDALESALKSSKNVRFIYTIPSFQNPTGFTTSVEKRRQIYELARRYNVLIFEDNPYGELRFSGEYIPPIKALDTDERVIYTGSFSKVMAPAFRLGTLAFPLPLTSKFEIAKQCTDVHSSTLFQYICHRYMTECDYDAHISDTCALYRSKSTAMLAAMKKFFHPEIKFNPPEGGLFLMAFLPQGMDSEPFVREGISRGVASVPGIAFAIDQTKPTNSFRLNYSTPTDGQILRGIEILGKLTFEVIS